MKYDIINKYFMICFLFRLGYYIAAGYACKGHSKIFCFIFGAKIF